MPVAKDTTMLKPSSRKVLIAMAEAGFEPLLNLQQRQEYQRILFIP